MKILVVSPYLPSPTWGAKARSFYMLQALARRHSISLLAIADQSKEAPADISHLADYIEDLRLLPRPATRIKRMQQLKNLLRGRSNSISNHTAAAMQLEFDRLMAQNQYDAVCFDSVLIAWLQVPDGIRTIIIQHNIEYELIYRTFLKERSWLRKWYNWCEYRLVKPFELDQCAKADLVLVTSEREKSLLQKMVAGCRLEVVPNGVNIEAFQANSQEREESGRIIYTGSMDYYPNTDAVQFFARECWPIIRQQVPGAQWQIVGENPPPQVQKLGKLPGVTVTGAVKDMSPYFSRAQVAIVPLRVGSGTRLKILEGLAMGKAMVSTSLGAEGLEIVPGEHLIIEDQPAQFAQAIVALLQDDKSRRALGKAGRQLVEDKYGWERTGEYLLQAVDQLFTAEEKPNKVKVK